MVTQEQVDAALLVLLFWIEQQPEVQVAGLPHATESVVVGDVRHMCYQLLHKANAYGYGGCPLCMA